MYAISNKHRDEILFLLDAIEKLTGNDNRTANIKRKARIVKRVLSKKEVKKVV